MDLINKLANTIEKSVILHFDNEEGIDDLMGFEFDRPVIGFASDLKKVKYISIYCIVFSEHLFEMYFTDSCFHILLWKTKTQT